jgi:hypothetical protein
VAVSGAAALCADTWVTSWQKLHRLLTCIKGWHGVTGGFAKCGHSSVYTVHAPCDHLYSCVLAAQALSVLLNGVPLLSEWCAF